MRRLLPQQFRRHNDVVRFDLADIELRQNIIPVDEAEQLVGRPTVQLSSFVGVDMRKHEVNILLLKVVKASAFRQDAPDKFVGDFDAALLIRGAGVAVEDQAAEFPVPAALNRGGVTELTAAIRQDDREKLAVGFSAENGVQFVKDRLNRSGGVGVPQEAEEQVAVGEEYRQEHLPSLSPNDRIHLDHRHIGIVGDKLHIVLISTTVITVTVNLFIGVLPPGPHTDDAGTIHLVSVKGAGIQKIVNGLLAVHQLVCIAHTDVVDGLAVLDKRGNDFVDALQFLRRDSKSVPGGRELLSVALICCVRFVLKLPQRAVLAFLAAVTDIGRLGDLAAYLLLKVGAVFKAEPTEAASFASVKAGVAQEGLVTGLSVNAGIERTAVRAGRDFNQVLSDFSGDRTGVFLQLRGDLRE